MGGEAVEIITGRERRRRWSVADKLRILAECDGPGAQISAVAARHAEGDQLRDNAAGAGHSDQGLGTLIETLKGLSGGGPTLVDTCTRTASIHSAASPNS